MKTLADYYTEPSFKKPQVVGYKPFLRTVDSVFVTPDLEKYPTMQVPRPGSSLQTGTAAFEPNPCDDEEAMQKVLVRIALMCKTRGAIFRTGFQDAERSSDTSLLCTRYAGKVTEMQFLQHFPFFSEISDYELQLVLQRYSNDSGDICYVAMDKDVTAVELDQASPTSRRSPISSRGSPIMRSRGPAAISVSGGRDSQGIRAESVEDSNDLDADLLGRLKADISSRRLRVHGCFQEMDKLRRGVCTSGQAKTVFTILQLVMDNKELAAIDRMFCDNNKFNYRDFCNVVNEVPLFARDNLPFASPTPSMRSGERARVNNSLTNQAEDVLSETELWIAKKSQQRSINFKSHFQ
ncbi:unnamed protein product, partial [Polarella glacialis]